MSKPYDVRPCNKSGWGNGPWQYEADCKEWADPTTGIECCIIRHYWCGHLCSYVKVPKSHPLCGIAYNRRAPMPKAFAMRQVQMGRDISPVAMLCASSAISEDCTEANLEFILQVHGGLTYSKGPWIGFVRKNSELRK